MSESFTIPDCDAPECVASTITYISIIDMCDHSQEHNFDGSAFACFDLAVSCYNAVYEKKNGTLFEPRMPCSWVFTVIDCDRPKCSTSTFAHISIVDVCLHDLHYSLDPSAFPRSVFVVAYVKTKKLFGVLWVMGIYHYKV